MAREAAAAEAAKVAAALAAKQAEEEAAAAKKAEADAKAAEKKAEADKVFLGNITLYICVGGSNPIDWLLGTYMTQRRISFEPVTECRIRPNRGVNFHVPVSMHPTRCIVYTCPLRKCHAVRRRSGEA